MGMHRKFLSELIAQKIKPPVESNPQAVLSVYFRFIIYRDTSER